MAPKDKGEPVFPPELLAMIARNLRADFESIKALYRLMRASRAAYELLFPIFMERFDAQWLQAFPEDRQRLLEPFLAHNPKKLELIIDLTAYLHRTGNAVYQCSTARRSQLCFYL